MGEGKGGGEGSAMRVVIQRVTEASVTVGNKDIASIGKGIVILLGVAREDSAADANFLSDKITGLRIFEDQSGKMNLSLLDIHGEVLIVSQFTLVADTGRGRRPSFDPAAPPEEAERLYETFIAKVKEKGLKVATGVFQAEMLVHIHNDGPVTFVLDSR